MPHVKATVHSIATMVSLIVGSILTASIREHIEVFKQLSQFTSRLLIDIFRLPISEEIAGIVIPVGILMAIWVLVYELRYISQTSESNNL